jgi:hypothetical protein
MLDERFTAPTTLECFAPADCTVLDQLMRHLFNFALPAQSSDGQHAGRLGSPAGGRVCTDESGRGLLTRSWFFPTVAGARHPFLDMSGLTPHMLKCYKDLSQRGREPIRPILRRAGLEVKANYIDA